jgi:hypothetical protein
MLASNRGCILQRVIIVPAILFALAAAARAAPPTNCAGMKPENVTQSAKAIRSDGMIYFRTSGLELDFDGSPHAYGVRDQGEENICAGLAPLKPPCRGKYRGKCFPVCQSTFAAWSRSSAGNPGKLADTMCSVGLGGSNCSTPDVRLQDVPDQDWFVSETSLKVTSPSGETDDEWRHKQGAQLDPAKIRYIVAPSAITKSPWSARYGDVGIAFNVATRKPIPFIVGDGGGLGEAAVSLLADLLPENPPRLATARSALGQDVQRYTRGIDGDFRFVVFTNTASNVPGRHPMIKQKVADLAAWIEHTATDALKRTSIENILACSQRAPAISK